MRSAHLYRSCSLLALGVLGLVALLFHQTVQAHHVLGRPTYSLNEDSNTPPSMQVETQIGDYFVNYMVYPAFPRAGEPGRINLYASHIDTGQAFAGEVRFTVRDDVWFGAAREEPLGTQIIDDLVYRQGFQFSEDGAYIITARFEAGAEPYIIDFPLRIGQPPVLGPLGVTVGAITLILLGVTIIRRRRIMGGKIQQTRAERRG